MLYRPIALYGIAMPIAVVFSDVVGNRVIPPPPQICPIARVFGEGVKSARGEIAIPRRGDHTRNMFGTSLHTAYCKLTIALETAEIMQ